ncbi:MAG: hypothetical protein HGA22_12760, partial [Clostridiales bacterium]|nr:hypothetical protein [Clostridiales bacterium]
MSAKIRLSLVVVLVVSMFTSICSAGIFAAGVPYAAASAPAVSNRIVFGSGVAEMAENAVTAEFAVHGYYNTTVADAKTKTEAFVLKTFSNAAKPTLYLDSKGTAATGIWVKYSSGKLSLTFKNAPYKNASYYVKMVDGNITTALTPVYVVAYSDKYLKGNSVTFFNLEDDGNKATNDTFTLPLSNDIKANQNNVSSVAPGGSQSIFSAADFKDLEDSSAEDKAAVNWYINSGITNGGDSWDEFTADRDYYAIGDGYLRLEAVHFLFRLFILDNEVKSGASGVGFTDVNPGIITSFVSLFPTSGTSFYRGDSVIDPKNN